MKKNAKTNEMNVTKKSINAAAKGMAAASNTLKKAAKEERKSLTATLRLLAESENTDFSGLKKWLGIDGKINRAALKYAAAKVMKHNQYIATVIDYKDMTIGNKPVSSTGRVVTDYIDVVVNAYKYYSITTAKRAVIAKAAWGARVKYIADGTYHDRVGNIINYINNPDNRIAKAYTTNLGVVRIGNYDMYDDNN